MPDIAEIRAKIASGSKRDAQRELARLLKEQPSNVDAWMLMAQVVDDTQKKADCYHKVLAIDPDNGQAKEHLGWLYSQPALTPEFETGCEDEIIESPRLEEVLEPVGGLPALTPPVQKRPRVKHKPRLWMLLSAAGLLLGVAALLMIAVLPSPLRKPIQSTPGASNLTPDKTSVTKQPFSSGAEFQAIKPKLRVLFVQDSQLWQWFDGETASISPIGADITEIAISPDGRRVALVRDGNLWIMNSSGGNAKQIVYSSLLPRDDRSVPATSRKVCHIRWSADGADIFFNSCSNLVEFFDLYMVRISAGEVTPLLPDGEGGLAYPSPDSRWVVSVAPEEIHLTNVGLNETATVLFYDRVLSVGTQWLAPIAWSEDSMGFLAAIPPVNGKNEPSTPVRLWLIPVDGSSKILAGEFFAQTNDVHLLPNADGALYFQAGPNLPQREWHWYEVSAHADHILAEEAASPVCWSPDGKELSAFTADSPTRMLSAKIPAGSVSEIQTGLNGTFQIEGAVCLGNGYLLVDGRDGDTSSVWLIGNGIEPVPVYALPADQRLVYKTAE